MKLCSKLITLSRTSRRTLAGLQKRPIFESAVSLNVCLAASARLPEVTDEDSFANLRSQISGLASASKFWYSWLVYFGTHICLLLPLKVADARMKRAELQAVIKEFRKCPCLICVIFQEHVYCFEFDRQGLRCPLNGGLIQDHAKHGRF